VTNTPFVTAVISLEKRPENFGSDRIVESTTFHLRMHVAMHKKVPGDIFTGHFARY